MIPAWTVTQNGQGSPWVTTTDGTNNTIVWVVGSGSGDQRLYGYNGNTGAIVYAGGGPNELMANTRKWNTGVVARGRLYFAADNKVYAFGVPAETPTPTPSPSVTPTATATATATSTPSLTPIPPSNLIGTAGGCLEIALSWADNSSNESGFKIERSQNNISFSQIASVGANQTSYTARQITPGLRYFRVRAYNAAGNSTYSNTASATGEACPTPAPTPALGGLTYNAGTPFVNGVNLISGRSYTVTAQADANTQSVLFKRDGATVKTDSAVPFDFTWTPSVSGNHSFAATPWSGTGATGISGASITVNYNVLPVSTPTPTP